MDNQISIWSGIISFLAGLISGVGLTVAIRIGRANKAKGPGAHAVQQHDITSKGDVVGRDKIAK